MSLIKDIRMIILVILLLLSAYFIFSPLVFKPKGVVVSFTGSVNDCKLKEGDIIEQINGMTVSNVEGFRNSISYISEGDSMYVVVNGNQVNCVASNKSMDVLVKDIEANNIKFGIDIEGGTRVLLKPKTNETAYNMDDIINTLNTRINLIGLQDIRVSPLGQNIIQIELAGGTGDDVKNFLAKQGVFEGKIKYEVELVNDSGKFVLDSVTYNIVHKNGSIVVGGMPYTEGKKLILDGIEFVAMNATSNSIIIMGTVFKGKDIVDVLTDAQNSMIRGVQGGYEFNFGIQISQSAAENFAKLTRGQPLTTLGLQNYIIPKLVLFLDNKPVTELNVVANLAGQSVRSASIQGFSGTTAGAFEERDRLASILRSGSLPVSLEIVKVDTITQTAGKGFIESTFYVAIAAVVAVSSIIFIILGFAAFSNMTTNGHGWTLDIPAVAGLIAIIGTGVNQLIIITDQMLLEKEEALAYRRKIAMSMIMNSAYIVIAAMLPLMFMGVGTLKGFAITTIIGVLIGVLITRPAYTAILERIEHLM